MFIPAKIAQFLLRLRRNAARLKHTLHRDRCPAEIDWPQTPPFTSCRPEVITWNRYLCDDIRDALVELYSSDRTDKQSRAAGKFLRSRSLKEQVRIDHFEWTFISYTVPDWPKYCVWLPRREIQSKIFASPVPPFMAIEYDRMQKDASRRREDASELSRLLFEEEIMLQNSQLLWKAEHYATFRFYKTLPYNVRDRVNAGRYVQWHY